MQGLDLSYTQMPVVRNGVDKYQVEVVKSKIATQFTVPKTLKVD